MNKFWEWMKQKGYGGKNDDNYKFDPPKQMIIGYMIEYIIEKDIEKSSDTMGHYLILYKSIDAMYEKLKNIIDSF